MLTPEEEIQKAFRAGQLSGSWLISGPRGVGKRDLAERICALLITGDMTRPLSFHANIRRIQCGLTEEAKKNLQKAILAGKAVEEDAELPQKSEITIDDIREGLQFLSLKAGANEHRILIVELAEQMNEYAANALLKALEEPPPRHLILLLCENAGKLLTTIRSRCRQMTLRPLPLDAFVRRLEQELPAGADVPLIAALAQGSPGMAREIYQNNGIALSQKMQALYAPLRQISIEELNSFAAETTENPKAFELFKFFLFNWMEAQIKQKNDAEEREIWLNLYDKIKSLYTDITRIYLDKKLVVVLTFLKIGMALK